MKKFLSIFGIVFIACGSAPDNKVTVTQKTDTMKKNKPIKKMDIQADTGWVYTGIGTVYEKKDAQGRVVERYGDMKKKDEFGKFRHFYQYDESGLFVKFMDYYNMDSEDCIIKDKDAYYYTLYFYDANKKCIKKELYHPWRDKDNKYVEHKIVMLYDYIKKEFRDRNPSFDVPLDGKSIYSQVRNLKDYELYFVPNPKKWSF